MTSQSPTTDSASVSRPKPPPAIVSSHAGLEWSPPRNGGGDSHDADPLLVDCTRQLDEALHIMDDTHSPDAKNAHINLRRRACEARARRASVVPPSSIDLSSLAPSPFAATATAPLTFDWRSPVAIVSPTGLARSESECGSLASNESFTGVASHASSTGISPPFSGGAHIGSSTAAHFFTHTSNDANSCVTSSLDFARLGLGPLLPRRLDSPSSSGFIYAAAMNGPTTAAAAEGIHLYRAMPTNLNVTPRSAPSLDDAVAAAARAEDDVALPSPPYYRPNKARRLSLPMNSASLPPPTPLSLPVMPYDPVFDSDLDRPSFLRRGRAGFGLGEEADEDRFGGGYGPLTTTRGTSHGAASSLSASTTASARTTPHTVLSELPSPSSVVSALTPLVAARALSSSLMGIPATHTSFSCTAVDEDDGGVGNVEDLVDRPRQTRALLRRVASCASAPHTPRAHGAGRSDGVRVRVRTIRAPSVDGHNGLLAGGGVASNFVPSARLDASRRMLVSLPTGGAIGGPVVGNLAPPSLHEDLVVRQVSPLPLLVSATPHRLAHAKRRRTPDAAAFAGMMEEARARADDARGDEMVDSDYANARDANAHTDENARSLSNAERLSGVQSACATYARPGTSVGTSPPPPVRVYHKYRSRTLPGPTPLHLLLANAAPASVSHAADRRDDDVAYEAQRRRTVDNTPAALRMLHQQAAEFRRRVDEE